MNIFSRYISCIPIIPFQVLITWVVSGANYQLHQPPFRLPQRSSHPHVPDQWTNHPRGWTPGTSAVKPSKGNMGPSRKEKGRKISSTSKSDFLYGDIYIYCQFPRRVYQFEVERTKQPRVSLVSERKHPISWRYCPAHNPATDCGFLLEFGMHLFRSL